MPKPPDTHDRKQRSQAKLRPPASPVDVPKTPQPSSVKDDVAAKESRPRSNPRADPGWSDTELPAPNKKKARPQNLF